MADVVDFSPLEAGPAPADVVTTRAEARRGAYGKTTKKTAGGPDDAVCLTVFVGGTLLMIFGITGLVQSLRGDPDLYILGPVVVGVLVLSAVIFVAARRVGRRDWRATTQLLQFAAANHGFDFQPHAKSSSRPAPVLGGVTGRAVLMDRMTWTAARAPVQAGHLHVGSNGGGGGSTTVRYLAVRLDLDLPDARLTHGRGEGFGPDLFDGDRPYALRADGLTTDPRLRGLFDDDVLGLLEERQVPASYADGWFVADYPRGERSDPATWRHRVALAAAVAAAARRARG